ncbi:MAG: CHAT domain-containing protein [Pyrinomonadaceae bacterium]|nr:CHAT domain-containing protein [Pyrinomonadaceae bacterium]
MNYLKVINLCSVRLAYRFTIALLILVTAVNGAQPSSIGKEKKLVITILRVASQNSAAKPEVLKSFSFDFSREGEEMIQEFKYDSRAGDKIRFRIENRSDRFVRLMLFSIGATGKVSLIYPSQSIDEPLSASRLEAGQRVETKDFNIVAPAGEERFKLFIGRLNLRPLDPNLGVSNRRSAVGPKGTSANQSNIGAVFSTSGDQGKSVDYYDLVLAILRSRTEKDIEAEITALNNRGLAYYKISDYGKAIGDYQEALKLLEGAELPTRTALKHRGVLLSNLGQVYGSLASYDLARKKYEEALALKKELEDKEGVAIVLNNIATVYSALNDYKSAERYYLDSLALAKELELDSVEATTLGSLAQTYLALNQTDKAADYALESIHLSKQLGKKLSEGLARNNLGSVYLRLKRYAEAIAQYQEAVALFRLEGNRMGEAIAYSNLMFAFEEYQKPLIAIAYGKWSVNLLQQIRRESDKLEKDLQKSFIASRGDTYRVLADLLISKGRIPEAERVLEMLKEEELLQYTLRDKAVANALSKRADLNARERKAIEDYALVSDKITAMSRELEELELEQSKLPLDAPFPKQARYDELKAKIASAVQTFAVFERQLEEEFGRNDFRVRQLNIGLQEKLKSWNSPDTVIISTIVGPRRTHIIVTTTGAQEPHTIDVPEEKLNHLIEDFRSAITDPCACLDPRPAGQKLYELLVKPIEGDLAGARAKTLVWSLDGALRYIPIAALWDGKQYLVERFQNVIITLASVGNISAAREWVKNWRALGAGVSQKRGEAFPALEAVPQELKNVVRQDNAANPAEEQGVIPGLRLLDADFKRDVFERARGRFSVIHIASHFDFKPSGEDSSVLLMGDGLLTLTEVFSTPTMFSGVELLTLSACNTATGGNGTEVEGFGGMAQARGAKAVLASLWAVADQSTGVLMRQFYANLRDNPAMTKAEALRQAQLDLLNGRVEMPRPGIDELRKKSDGKTDEARNRADFVPDPKSPRAHPYYWAPFILMGNWK